MIYDEDLSNPIAHHLAVAEVDDEPLWANSRRFDLIRRGVYYTFVPEDGLRAFLEQPDLQILATRAAIGPRLFFARRDGPIIPYDLNAKDENLGIHVRARPWPYSFGDLIWVLCEWITQPVVIRIDFTSAIEFYVGTPKMLGAFVDAFPSWVDPKSVDVVEAFRTFRPPRFQKGLEMRRGKWRKRRKKKRATKKKRGQQRSS